MNSCLPVLISTDAMHSFLRDKQAWENAISMYQGPDPLDHWYNYVCWYENHLRGDPENKFRETLERCLALFEHSEFYKQDLRLVRLWLKYIEMQTHPLHFYQVLYQRGVGRQVAAFYIGWAGYYQSIHALKEAESVFSLAFQEKAQSYEELNHAHTKFLYMQTAATQLAIQHQQHLSGLQLNQHEQPHQIQHQQPGCIHHTLSHTQLQQESHTIPQQTAQMESQGHTPQLQNYHRQLTSATASNSYYQPHALASFGAQDEQLYQVHSYQNELNFHSQTEHSTLANQINGSSLAVHQINLESSSGTAQEKITMGTNYNKFEKVLSTAPKIEQSQVNVVELIVTKLSSTSSLSSCKLPRKFAAYCRNNYETWKPALFLEEPEDPNRHCHYAKHLVYPGNGAEYSPEELRAKKYVKCKVPSNRAKQIEENERIGQELQEIGPLQRQQHNKDEATLIEDTDRALSHKHRESTSENVGLNGADLSGQNFQNTISYAQTHIKQNHLQRPVYIHHQNDKQQKLLQEDRKLIYEAGNTLDDLEDQIEASTIRLGENKTIKIKFKKDPQQQGHTLKRNNYVIEGIYQQEVLAALPSTPECESAKNGHSFHPYIMDSTSTPKSNSKRYKAKLKRINKIPIGIGSSSNSSSAENVTTNGNNCLTANEHIKSLDNADEVLNNATFNDNANFSFSSAVALDSSHCSLISDVGRLHFRDSTSVYNTSNVADISTYQENSYFATQNDIEAKERRLRKAHEIIEHHLAKEAIDPFNSELCRAFLTKLDFPGLDDSCTNYKIVQTPLPKIANTRTLSFPNGVQFNIDKEVGRGSYGSVYKATDANSGNVVALKFQKPPNTWEIYICDQVLKRIKTTNILPGLMDISVAIIAPNASIIATEFSPFGSLLDINNKIRQATTKVMHESLVMHFSAQICNIINHLHMNKIIHADIKPDNFLLMRIPSTDHHCPSLRLIDFGCAIDMTLFPHPEKTKFRKVIQTDGFTCIEMQENRPWSYETDLFCIAGTVHVMLLGEYMQLQKRSGIWDIKQKLPRYLKKHVWTKFFNDMLNIKVTKLPDLNEMYQTFNQEAARMDSELQSQIRTLSNILHRR